MSELFDYIHKHVERGECNCGRCIDVGNKPDPTGHTADLVFFKVVLMHDPDAEVLRQLSRNHRGAHSQVKPFDGDEHGYIELGGWLDDQGTALMFMGMASLLGIAELMTPTGPWRGSIPEAQIMASGDSTAGSPLWSGVSART